MSTKKTPKLHDEKSFFFICYLDVDFEARIQIFIAIPMEIHNQQQKRQKMKQIQAKIQRENKKEMEARTHLTPNTIKNMETDVTIDCDR